MLYAKLKEPQPREGEEMGKHQKQGIPMPRAGVLTGRIGLCDNEY